jgi:DNA polymerase-3 subunit delta'
MFAPLLGNEHIQRGLELMLQRNTVGNSLLFAGPDGIGKSLFAEHFARLLVGMEPFPHPDLHYYHPEGKLGMHTIDAMSKLAEEVYLPPYQAKKKVFIIYDAERMLPTSSNALLKTFEEPSVETVIILVSSAPELILDTIISRCRVLEFHPLKESEIASLLIDLKKIPHDRAHEIASLSAGSAGAAFAMAAQGESPIRSTLLQILAVGRFSNYTALMATAKELGDAIGERGKEIEECTRTELMSAYTEKLSAVQREALEKEIDGRIAMHLAEESKLIFDTLLSWFRDRHLLTLGGERSAMLNPDRYEEAKAAKTPLPPLEEVLDAIKDAKTSLARSTSLQICLETLFLRLNLY